MVGRTDDLPVDTAPVNQAAIELDGTVYAAPYPYTHAKVREVMKSVRVDSTKGVEGFLTLNGTFLPRKQAEIAAKANDQKLWC